MNFYVAAATQIAVDVLISVQRLLSWIYEIGIEYNSNQCDLMSNNQIVFMQHRVLRAEFGILKANIAVLCDSPTCAVTVCFYELVQKEEGLAEDTAQSGLLCRLTTKEVFTFLTAVVGELL